ncbi:MAG: transglutaminase domain-containing protein [Candidatus Thorarchaeota archaeon]|nr:transglutaminase domain-containing protein [Candidatus Thorarchaeota archaeon]
MVIIHTMLNHVDGDFDTLRVFLKCPSSDPRQKIELIGINHPFKVTHERWSTLYNLEINHQAFDPRTKQASANIILNIDFERRNPYRISDATSIADLPEILKEIPDIADYLESHDYIETGADEISQLASEIVNEDQSFWSAVRAIAQWVNTYIVYSYDLQDKNYRGALETLRSRRGTCSDFVHLFLALARNNNIPSRAMVGLQRHRRSWKMHSWAEVYDPQIGWAPIDVVSQPVNLTLDSGYIGISAGYNCAVRLFAYYDSQRETNSSVKLKLKQYYVIRNQPIEIEFFEQ